MKETQKIVPQIKLAHAFGAKINEKTRPFPSEKDNHINQNAGTILTDETQKISEQNLSLFMAETQKIHQHTLNSFFQICSSGPKFGLYTVWYSY